MLRINNVKLQVGENEELLGNKICQKLKIKPEELITYSIQKKALDSRKKNNIFYTYNINIEVKNSQKALKNKDVIEYTHYEYQNIIARDKSIQPVIIGLGPAGLMSAIILCEAGLKPIILEQGKDVWERKKDIDNFWSESKLKKTSNVQFGAGGAGTFSDGKLTTGVKDKNRIKLLTEFINAGAPSEIMYLSKPHIGTDILIGMVDSMCQKIISLGGDIRYEQKFIDFQTTDGSLNQISVNDLKSNTVYEIETEHLILAIGHSSRDTFEMLHKNNITIKPKPFAVGMRMEHLQADVNKTQYGNMHSKLDAADYKLSTKTKDGTGVYTFCMCPGGLVVASSSEENTVVTNGMSYYKRDQINANSALLVSITPDDYMENNHPLSGMYFQQKLEKLAYNDNYFAYVQRVGDFINEKASINHGKIIPSYKPGVIYTNLHDIFPHKITYSIKEAIINLQSRIEFMKCDDAILTAIETRSSSPITILRDDNKMCNTYGIYPCGEGAGYAGGIVSAGLDGIRCAEHLLNVINN